MLEKKLLDLIKIYSEQMEEIMEDEENIDKVDEIYANYIGAYEQLLSIDFIKYAEEVANEYYLLADFYVQYKEDIEKAIEVSNKKLEIYKKLAEYDEKYIDEVGYCYIEIAEIYENADIKKEANDMYELARKINPQKFLLPQRQ